MGRAAANSDRIVLTSDNPRSEDPGDIARAIRDGIGEHRHVSVVLDRQEAIRQAVLEAEPDDVIVIAGRGHETEQQLPDQVRRFSDHEVVRELFAG